MCIDLNTVRAGAVRHPHECGEAIAVGRCCLVEEVQRDLGARVHYRSIAEDDGASALRESDESYGPIPASKWAA